VIYRMGTTDFRMSNSAFAAKYFSISPGYLDSAGTHLLSGAISPGTMMLKRRKSPSSTRHSPRAMFGDTSALGRQFMMGDKVSYEIVGVVENGKYDSLTESPWAAVSSLSPRIRK